VMTFPAINAADLIKKVEALEFELDVHVGNERQLLTVNEKLRKRSVNLTAFQKSPGGLHYVKFVKVYVSAQKGY
jgi:hypothetical protein